MPCYNIWSFPLVKVQPVSSSKTYIMGRTILSIITKKLLLTGHILYIKANVVLIDRIIISISHQQSIVLSIASTFLDIGA